MPCMLLSERAADAYGEALTAYGYSVIPIPADPLLNPLVADHADTLIFRGHTTLVASETLIAQLPDDIRGRFSAAVILPMPRSTR